MLATQQNDKIHNGDLENFTIIRITKLVVNTMQAQNKKVVIILDLEVLRPGSEVGRKIGNPQQIGADGVVSGNQNKPTPSVPEKRASDELSNQPPPKKPLQAQNHGSGTRSSILDPRPVGAGHIDKGAVFPIASLSPYQNRWTIKARVTNKSDIRRWNNSRGEGHLFSMDLVDESGEIRATAFKEQCDKFYNMIEIGKVFYISSCQLKPANKQYSNLKNDYEMTFRESTEVVPCSEDTSNIPSIMFDFVKISDLTQVAKDTTIDIIGVCKHANDVASIMSTKLNKELRKRDITLVDQSNTEVNMTLWGGLAETFDGSSNPVVAIKGAKVSDFNGVSLSALSSSVVQVNPDMPQAHSLKGWYDSVGPTLQTSSLTQSGRGGEGAAIGANLKTLAEVKIENLGMEKPDYYSTVATITMMKKENVLYQACSQVNDGKQCNKKVQDQNNGSYRCEKCNMEMERFNWRAILNFSLGDATGNQWANCFQETAETILGVSAEQLGDYMTNDQDKFNRVFQESTFKLYNFRLRCKADTYNDEMRIRHTVVSVTPVVDWVEHNRRIIKELDEAGVQLPAKIDRAKYA